MRNGIVHFLPEQKRSKIACLTARRRPPPKHSTESRLRRQHHLMSLTLPVTPAPLSPTFNPYSLGQNEDSGYQMETMAQCISMGTQKHITSPIHYGYWTTCRVPTRGLDDSLPGHLADCSTRGLDNSRMPPATLRGQLSFSWRHLQDRELSSPQLVQSASWQSASWRIRRLSSYLDYMYISDTIWVPCIPIRIRKLELCKHAHSHLV